MNIEQARDVALSMPFATEDEFYPQWISYRIDGKWFMLIQLDAPEPRVAVKLPPVDNIELRARYNAIRPAYHMNHTHWSDLYLNGDLSDTMIGQLIRRSYALVASKLPKSSVHYGDIHSVALEELALTLDEIEKVK